MKNTVIRRSAAIVAALCMSACAHNPTPVAAAAKSTATAPQSGPSANITANMPPDVLATCQHSAAEMGAGHLAEAARLTNECLASHSLPVALRTQMLQGLTFVNMALRDDRAALDSQLAAIELTPVPSDVQLVLLAHLYGTNQRNDESLATLDRIRIAHEARHDLDQTIGAPYYQELGSALAREKRFPESIDAYSKAIALEPALAELYRRRAFAREASGDTAGARADYVQFARWALDAEMDTSARTKLSSLGIDVASERRHPFGDTNPLYNTAVQQVGKGQQALKSATTAQAKAEAYSDISAFSDDLGRPADALTAIDKAIALAPDDTSYKQSKVTTLLNLNRIDAAIAYAAPIRKQAHEEAAAATAPFAVYKKYREVSSSVAVAYIQQGKWSEAIDALVDSAKGAAFYDQDYMATMYLYVRAKSAGAAPANPYFDDYIRRTAQPVLGNYRRELLLYMQGKLTLDQVYMQVISLGDQAAIQNALAEIWFMAAAYARYVKHDDDAARAFVGRLNDLQPYGTTEWMMVQRGGA
ncbi:tetratricopeptide repeat protein [Paraburkholderia caffeinilytica]|uniref:tetratricopeptide repeat protein n=1 Tax=Paraburkholderia caffeinilytica TaxID=1761016 RepID=UPI0038B714F9